MALTYTIVMNIADLTTQERRACRRLTRPNGMMRYWLDVDLKLTTALAKKEGEIIGWAALTHPWNAQFWEVGVFVAPQFRRRGIGRKLINHLLTVWHSRRLASGSSLARSFHVDCDGFRQKFWGSTILKATKVPYRRTLLVQKNKAESC